MHLDQVPVGYRESSQLVIETFRSFRDELMASYGVVEYVYKSDHSQVTELDLRIEKTLRQALAESFENLGFLGEETGDGRAGNQPYWVVDPIDGTSSFIRGLPNCTNMAALVQDGQPVIGIIYDFVTDRMFEAYKGQGAYVDGQRISIHDRPIDQAALYIQSLSALPPVLRNELRTRETELYRPIGASGHAYTLLAEGKIDGYVLLGSKKSIHDNAPGVLIAQEAGAEVYSPDGQWTVESSDFICATPSVVRAARELMSPQG